MATLDDTVLDRLRELNGLRDRAKELRERGRNALAAIPEGFTPEKYKKLEEEPDLSSDQWVSGSHPVDVALLVRVLNHRDLGDYDACPPNELHDTLEKIVVSLFEKADRANDSIPVLTAARAMHTLVGRPQTVFSKATMLCYYRIVRELYLATYPNWIIGAARAGEGGRVSAFVTGECVRAILAFQNAIRDTITFFRTTKELCEEIERLQALPNIDIYLADKGEQKSPSEVTHWQAGLAIEFERVVLDWYAANNLRRSVIALNLASDLTEKPKSSNNGLTERSLVPSLLPLAGTKRISRAEIEKALDELPNLLRTATKQAKENIAEAKKEIEAFRVKEAGLLEASDLKDLQLVAKRLTDPGNEYKYYRKEISKETMVALCLYHGGSSIREDRPGESLPAKNEVTPEENKLKEDVVRELNEKCGKYLMASRSDWKELGKRVAEKPRPERFVKFPKETEWLVERHLAVIKLVAKKESVPGERSSELIQLNRLFLEKAFSEKRDGKEICAFGRIDSRRFDVTLSAHSFALRVVRDALVEAERAAELMKPKKNPKDNPGVLAILDRFNEQYLEIYRRIRRVIDPAKRYIQDVLNRELAQAANSAKFDAGELLFAATCFGAITRWKQNEQLAEARRLLTGLLPEDGRLQTSRPFQSTSKGERLIPIAFEMTRSLAQLLQKDFVEDLDPKVVRKILNIFEENRISLSPDGNEKIGWNFSGAPESQKPSVWVTSIGVFALDRIVRMLNERINSVVLRHFNVEMPNAEVESLDVLGPTPGNKLDLSKLIYPDYELQSASPEKYEEPPHRVDRVSIAIRLQQMRVHLTRALLPDFYSKKSQDPKYRKAYSAIFYGPPGTGKTSLAEALAHTAKVPLVRLSPSDLMVQGTDVIESRARAIFDSLSMLTQAVIFLDEFEPVVRTRGGARKDNSQDPTEFKFLVTGMLPKLIKLNKAAEAQSVVYCLATNYLVEVDDAAKRVGRFDLQIPIYNPDPISRVGVFLSQLVAILQKEENEKEGKPSWRKELQRLEEDKSFWRRVRETVEKTEEVSAQSLATVFFNPGATKSFFNYVRNQDVGSKAPECPTPTPEKSMEKHKTKLERDLVKERTKYELAWKGRRHPTKRPLRLNG